MKSDGTIERESAYLAQVRAARARNEADGLQRENRRLRDLLAFTERENAQLRERLQLLESRAAVAEAFESAMLDDDGDAMARQVINGLCVMVEARR